MRFAGSMLKLKRLSGIALVALMPLLAAGSPIAHAAVPRELTTGGIYLPSTLETYSDVGDEGLDSTDAPVTVASVAYW
jgi:hypothetical protein